jgi:hypothetical protein
MCVRLCDGYYWPVTFNAKRSRLGHDAKVCSSSCVSEARIFTMPDSGEAKDMVDQQGRPYLKLANAFKYRKAQTNMCTCKPDPWDNEARARHQAFAAKSEPGSRQVADALPTDAAAQGDDKQVAATESKRMSIAEAELLSLAGGGVIAGAVVGPNVADALPVASKSNGLADAGGQKTAGPPAADKTVKFAAKLALAKSRDIISRDNPSRDQRRAEPAVRPAPPRSRGWQPHATPTPAMIMTNRGYVPAGYGRYPTMIVQPQGVAYPYPYRTN